MTLLQVIDFYEYYEGLQEGWDGPALLVFSDGNKIGARLDRNGLRPARFWETDDGMVYVASEVGVLGDVLSNAKHTVRKGRLGPGQMVCADLADVGLLSLSTFAGVGRSPRAIVTLHVIVPWGSVQCPTSVGSIGSQKWLSYPAASLLCLCLNPAPVWKWFLFGKGLCLQTVGNLLLAARLCHVSLCHACRPGLCLSFDHVCLLHACQALIAHAARSSD